MVRRAALALLFIAMQPQSAGATVKINNTVAFAHAKVSRVDVFPLGNSVTLVVGELQVLGAFANPPRPKHLTVVKLQANDCRHLYFIHKVRDETEIERLRKAVGKRFGPIPLYSGSGPATAPCFGSDPRNVRATVPMTIQGVALQHDARKWQRSIFTHANADQLLRFAKRVQSTDKRGRTDRRYHSFAFGGGAVMALCKIGTENALRAALELRANWRWRGCKTLSAEPFAFNPIMNYALSTKHVDSVKRLWEVSRARVIAAIEKNKSDPQRSNFLFSVLQREPHPDIVAWKVERYRSGRGGQRNSAARRLLVTRGVQRTTDELLRDFYIETEGDQALELTLRDLATHHRRVLAWRDEQRLHEPGALRQHVRAANGTLEPRVKGMRVALTGTLVGVAHNLEVGVATTSGPLLIRTKFRQTRHEHLQDAVQGLVLGDAVAVRGVLNGARIAQDKVHVFLQNMDVKKGGALPPSWALASPSQNEANAKPNSGPRLGCTLHHGKRPVGFTWVLAVLCSLAIRRATAAQHT